MEITGEIRLPATRQEVWDLLNDPAVLQRCIPGCTAIEKRNPTEFFAHITAKVGPVRSSFSTQLTLDDLHPPESYTLTGQGQGESTGMAKGSVKILLLAEATETCLQYTSTIKISGKLAQVGSRLMTATVKKWIEKFFIALQETITEIWRFEQITVLMFEQETPGL